MGITFTNNWKNISDKLRSTFRTEFKGALPVYINDEPVSTGGQFLQLDLAGTELSEKMLGCELREYSVNLNYIFQNPNMKKSSLDHVLRYVSRIEQLMQNNISLTLTDSTAAVNCRVESTTLEEGVDSYLVSFDWKCQHLSGLSETVATTPALLNNYSLAFDGTDDYVDCGTGITDITSGACTISGWYKIISGHDVATDGKLTFFSRGAGSATSGYSFRYEDSGGTKRIILFQTKSGGYNYIAYNVTLTTDTWYHIAWVNGGTGSESSFYINGSQVATATHSQDIISASSVSFKIGSNSSLAEEWKGNIDEVAIWNSALPATEVAAIYNSKAASSTTLDLGYDTVDYKSADNLLAYWRMGSGRFDEFDRIFSKDDVTFGSNLATSFPSLFVFTYNSTTEKWNYDDSGTGYMSTGTITAFEAGVYRIEFTLYDDSVTNGQAQIYLGAVKVSDNLKIELQASTALDTSASGTSHTVYGVTTESCDEFIIYSYTNQDDFFIDNIRFQKVTNDNTGVMTNMDAVDISTEVPKQITSLQAVPNTYSLDFDGTNDYLTCEDVSDFDFGATSPFSVSGWFKWTGDSITDTYGGVICGKGAFAGGVAGFSIYVSNDTDKLGFQIRQVGASPENIQGASGSALTAGTWYHFAAVRESGSVAKLYLNGSLESTFDPASRNVNNDHSFVIGALNDNASDSTSMQRQFLGNIDEIGVFNAALDADAVKALYNGGNPIDLTVNNGAYDEYTDNLKGYWRMGDGTLDTFPLIADQVDATLGSDIWDDDYYTGSYPAGITEVGDELVFDNYTGYLVGSAAGTRTIGRVYKYIFEVTEITSGSASSIHPEESGTYQSVGSHTKYIIATTIDYSRFYFHAFTGKIKKSATVQQVQGNAGLMTNMVAGDIEEDTP